MEQRGKRDSFFVRAFGDLGELVQFFLGFLALMAVMVVGIPLLVRLPLLLPGGDSTKTSKPPVDTVTILGQVRELQEHTQRVRRALDVEITQVEEALRLKKAALLDLTQRIEALELTPAQAAIIGTRQTAEPPGFVEWISSRPVWYDIIVSFVIAAFFYWRGRRAGITKAAGAVAPG